MKTTTYICYLLLFVLFSSCDKQEDFTQQIPTGENSVYYYLNGVLIVPKDIKGNFFTPTFKPISIYYDSFPNGSVAICINEDILGRNTLKLDLFDGIQTVGNISLGFGNSGCCNNSNNFGLLENRKDIDQVWEIFQTKEGSGTINIETISADKRKFTGSFQMDVFSDVDEVKHITNGHFNINLDRL